MVDPKVFQSDVDAAADKLRTRLGARGRTLSRRLKNAGRALPKPARQAGLRLVELQAMMAHPRLRRLVRRSDVEAALAALTAPLNTIDVKERRKDRLLGFAGSAVGNLLLLALLVMIILHWRGLI
jgi:hypothetical protein